jgi:hypothetical protein
MAVDIGTNEVGRQQIRGKLYTVIIALDRFRECLYRGGLCQSGHSFQQYMTVTQQADKHTVYKVMLPDDPGGKMFADAIQDRGVQSAIVGGVAGI